MKLIETQRLIMRPLEKTDFDDFLDCTTGVTWM